MNPRSVDTSERPVVLVWEVTQACELACKHCRADAQPGRHPEELSTTEGKALLEEAATFGDDQLVVLSGGDPLVRPDLVDLVEFGTGQGLRMTVTPSGTSALTRDRVAALESAGLRRMALSIDGASPSTHDAFRGEDGSFEETLRAARVAADVGVPLQINTTVCAETVDELPGIRSLVGDLDAVLWSVFFLVPVGRGQVLDPITPTQAERVMTWLAGVADDAPFRVKTTEAPHYRRVAMQRRTDRGGPPPSVGEGLGVTAGNGFAFVSHTGEVFPSGFLPQPAGNVRDRSVVDLYRDAELFTQLRDPAALGGKCGVCPYRGVCGGSRSRAFAHTGDPMAADPLCAYVPPGYDGPLPEANAD
jgi:radical SAM protein with 4Fe4S-binding SPASM domain